jgi:hypothetical protein
MEKLLGTEWLVEQLRNGKELNDELIQEAKELELSKFNQIKVEIKDYEPEVHLLSLAIQSVGIKIDYITCDLINSTLKVFNKLNGKMTIMDSCKIKSEHEKKWDLFFKTKQEN